MEVSRWLHPPAPLFPGKNPDDHWAGGWRKIHFLYRDSNPGWSRPWLIAVFIFENMLWKCSYCVSGVYLFGSPLGTTQVWMRKLSVLSSWSASGHYIWRRHDGAICFLSSATRVDFRIDAKWRRLLILSAEPYNLTNNTVQQKSLAKYFFFSGILPTLGSYRLVLTMKCSCVTFRVAWFMDFPFPIHIQWYLG